MMTMKNIPMQQSLFLSIIFSKPIIGGIRMTHICQKPFFYMIHLNKSPNEEITEEKYCITCLKSSNNVLKGFIEDFKFFKTNPQLLSSLLDRVQKFNPKTFKEKETQEKLEKIVSFFVNIQMACFLSLKPF